MEKQRLNELLVSRNLSEFRLSELQNLIEKYPWFELPRILYLLKLKEEDAHAFKEKLAEFAVFFHDRKQVFRMLNSDLRTKLIEDFNATVKENENLIELEIPAGELLDFSYQANFNSRIPESEKEFTEKENKKKEPTGLIDRFLIEEPGPIRADKKTNLSGDVSSKSVQESENLLTDTLAKIYVKQGLYSKAIFAYEKLSLKYPEKSVYFASQIKEIKEITNKK